MVGEDVLSRRSRFRKSAKSSGSRTSRATLRAIVAADKASFAEDAQPRRRRFAPGATRSTPGDIARRIADAEQGRRRRLHLRRPRVVPRHDRTAGDDELSRLRRLQGRTRGTRDRCCCRRSNILEGIDLKSVGRQFSRTTSTRCTRRSSSPTPIATRYYGDPAFATGADGRSAVEGLRR